VRLAGVLGATVFALALTEGALRALDMGSPVDGTDLVQRWVPPDIYVPDADPSVGHRLRVGYVGVQEYRSAADGSLLHAAPTRVDDAGFREEGGRREGRRIVAVGDSTTFGVGVADGESWPAALERQLPEGWRVTNAGVPGRNIAQEVAWLASWRPDTRPDIVLLAFYLNDLAPPVPVQGDIAAIHMAAPPWASREAGFRRTSRIYNLWCRSWERRKLARSLGGSAQKQVEESTSRASAADFRVRFEQLQHAAQTVGARPIVVLLPVLDVPDARAADPMFAMATEGAREARMPLIHAEHALDDMDIPDRVVLPGERHASPEGNARIAAVIREGLAGLVEL
jgi:lysophospholipase L1-like esterase